MRTGKLAGYGLVIATIALMGCAGPPPGPGPGGGDRRGPPPFSALDLDRDDVLTLDEFERHQIPQGNHADILRSIDANADGVVTRSEYESHRPPRPPVR